MTWASSRCLAISSIGSTVALRVFRVRTVCWARSGSSQKVGEAISCSIRARRSRLAATSKGVPERLEALAEGLRLLTQVVAVHRLASPPGDAGVRYGQA